MIPLFAFLRPRKEKRTEVLRGTADRVIRVRDPVPGVFREAVFFLEEDYLRRGGCGERALMREAKRAAAEYLRGRR